MKYHWQNSPPASRVTTLEIDKSLGPGDVLVDLYNGEKYRVLSIQETRKPGSEGKNSPTVFADFQTEAVLRTASVSRCSKDELGQLRKRFGYIREDGAPFLDVVAMQ